MKLFLRIWYLPVLTASLRASAGTSNFLELRAALETGVWGSFLAEKLGFSLEYVRRFGSPWSNQQMDENSLTGSIKINPAIHGK